MKTSRHRIVIALTLFFAAAFAWLAFFPVGQQPDRAYRPSVERPAHTAKHPVVLIDEGHYNAHTATGGYSPFARLVRADGYDVRPHRGAFTRTSLAGTDVLVVVNADGGSNPKLFGFNLVFMRKGERGSAAFAPSEIAAVEAWVREGGSLLLVADHAPFGTASAALASAFGVTMRGGFAGVPPRYASPNDPCEVTFSTENGLLTEHPIARGRDDGESLARVRSFTGQSLDAGRGTIILRLPAGSVDAIPNDPTERPAGAAQGVAIEHGAGRVVVLGEAAMLTAQAEGKARWGMNTTDIDNEQLALNVMHWLSRVI